METYMSWLYHNFNLEFRESLYYRYYLFREEFSITGDTRTLWALTVPLVMHLCLRNVDFGSTDCNLSSALGTVR